MSKKIISFSVWGSNPVYTVGAIRNAELAKLYLPDWKCMFFVGEKVPASIIKELERLDCEIVPTALEENHTGMFWRFTPATMWEEYDYVLSRDTDSRLTKREADEINLWISSGKMFHSIIAHPYHNLPILGGLWGVKTNASFCKHFDESFTRFNIENRYQIDQDFLNTHIYPFVKDDIYVSNMMLQPQNSDFSFIGEGYDELNQPLNLSHREILKTYYNNISENGKD